jgi:hypothetical protein
LVGTGIFSQIHSIALNTGYATLLKLTVDHVGGIRETGIGATSTRFLASRVVSVVHFSVIVTDGGSVNTHWGYLILRANLALFTLTAIAQRNDAVAVGSTVRVQEFANG